MILFIYYYYYQILELIEKYKSKDLEFAWKGQYYKF